MFMSEVHITDHAENKCFQFYYRAHLIRLDFSHAWSGTTNCSLCYSFCHANDENCLGKIVWAAKISSCCVLIRTNLSHIDSWTAVKWLNKKSVIQFASVFCAPVFMSYFIHLTTSWVESSVVAKDDFFQSLFSYILNSLKLVD